MSKHDRPSSSQGVLKRLAHRYFIDAMGAMAMGLFCSLIIGLILKQVFTVVDVPGVSTFVEAFSLQTAASSPVVGAAIGVAVAFGLKARPLALYSACVAGAVGYSVMSGGVSAGPVGAFVAAVAAAEVGGLVYGRTKLDILLVPAASLLAGTAVGLLVGPPVASLMHGLGSMVNEATTLRPLPMGILVATIMGAALTAPISSAAIAIMLGLDGLAAGAATAGCCAHMIAFGVASYRDNGFAGLLAQGLGTSMLQVANIVKRPMIALPAIVAAFVGGALATTVFEMRNLAVGAGMGTAGLVGPIVTWTAMSSDTPPLRLALSILVLFFVVPGALAWATAFLMRKWGLLSDGDMKLDL